MTGSNNISSNHSDIFYRYEIVQYASMSMGGEYYTPSIPNPQVVLREFNLRKETPKGYWIGYGTLQTLHDKGWWVSKTARKRYAYPTKEEALINFIKRNERRLKILSRHVDVCKTGIYKAKLMLEGLTSVKQI